MVATGGLASAVNIIGGYNGLTAVVASVILTSPYPVFETFFSIWRKRVVRGASPGVPDGLHLHMLVFRRLVRWAVGRRDAASLTLRNIPSPMYYHSHIR